MAQAIRQYGRCQIINMAQTDFNKKLVFGAACLGMLLFGIVMISLGSLLPDIKEKVLLDGTAMGRLATLLPLGILIGSLVFGPLIDWVSYKYVLIFGAGTTAMGLSGISQAHGVELLYISIFFIGLGGGVLNGATNALVSEISTVSRSADLSILGVFYGVGALGTPAVLGLLKNTIPYTSILLGLVGLILLFLFYFVVLRFPKSNQTKGLSILKVWNMVKDPFLLLLGFILFFQSGLEGLTNNWSALFMEQNKGLSTSNALFILSALVGALTLTRLIMGKLLRVYQPLGVLVTGFAIALLGYILLWLGNGYVSLMCAFLLIGVGLAAGFPVILGYVGHSYTEHSGTAFSIVITIALIGNVLLNYTLGQVTETRGLSMFPLFLILSVVLVFVLLFILNKKLVKIN